MGRDQGTGTGLSGSAGPRKRAEGLAFTLLTAGLAVGALIENAVSPTVTISGRDYDRATTWSAVAVLTIAVVLVALRGRLGLVGPTAALAVLGLAAFPSPPWLLGSSFVFLLAMTLCGLCGYLTATRTGLVSLGVIWAVAALAEWRNPVHTLGHGIFVGTFMTIAWCIGFLARRPVSQAREAEERATRFELEQEEAAARAVVEERQRIARELHDIIAHSVSVMTMQAGAVRRLLRPDQERERESLLSVEQTGRDAMAEMRRLVGLLKQEEAAAAYSPQPGMHSLDALVSTVREAGLPVEVTHSGEQHELPPGVDLTAFRVVQEALTNALKHAHPEHAWVRVCWSSDELRIEVANDGRAESDAHPAGFGHAGMRERLGLYGGRLESGPGSSGGYVVRAVLPVRNAP